MNIAHIVPHSIRFPLEQHQGRYDLVINLAKLQVQMGHDVTIYCHPESKLTSLKTRGIVSAAPDKKNRNIETFKMAFKGGHDVYHSHLDNLHYEVGHLTRRSIIFTQHWWPVADTLSLAKTYKGDNVWAVPPTRYMYSYDQSSGIPTKEHIYHGIDLQRYKPTPDIRGNRILFVGRISPEKNLDIAIRAAQRASVGLDIVGKITDKNHALWKDMEKYIDGSQIRYLGTKTQGELVQLYSKAASVIFPSEPTEAFGLVALEAQACGSPIIMKKGGSRSELLIEGKTGFLCESDEDFAAAIRDTKTLSSQDCRHFAQQFDIKDMAKNYEDLYESLV